MAQYGSGHDGSLTVADVRAAIEQGRTGARMVVRDGKVGGLYLRAGGRGGMWFFEYRMAGRDGAGRRPPTHHLRLGAASAVNPEEARREAETAKGMVLKGNDPQLERAKARQAAVSERERTRSWGELRPDYETRLKVQLSNLRSRANELWYLGRAFGEIGATKPIAQISRGDVLRMLDALAVKSKANARHALSALGRFLDWCGGERSIVAENVVRQVPRGRVPTPPKPRERVLSLAECALLWNGVETLDDLPRQFLRLLLALPVRRGELMLIDWGWLDRKARTLTLPGRVMKNGELHRLPLGPLAVAVLDQRAGGEKWPATGRVFVTDNTRGANWTWLKRLIDRAVPLEHPWTFHDTRRAFVTGLAEAGVAEVVCDSMIAHRQSKTRGGVLAVYQKAAHWPAQVAAMAKWHMLLTGAITGERGEVVQFPAAG